MPARAMQVCARGGCGKLASGRFCPEHLLTRREERKQFDQRRSDDPIRKLYSTKGWQATRRLVLYRDPLCKLCKVAFSTIADHVIPARKWIAQHGGELESFFDDSNLQGICKPCHDAKTAKECGWAGNKE
jgi:5-methylcytosine-specific restriction enzyme A